MRVRSDATGNTRRVARMLTVVALMMGATVLGLAPSSSVFAACGGSTSIDGDGGGVTGFCWGVTPGQPPGFGSYSMEQRWAIHCGGNPWVEGSTVGNYDHLPLDLAAIEARGFDPTGSYMSYYTRCSDPAGNYVYARLYYREVTAPVAPEVLRDIAAARINPPNPSVASNPPLNQPGRFGIVNFPTWLWISDPWETIGPESETAGFVTVEVSATPRKVTWVTGDGSEPVVCGGPGVPWSAGMADEASDCTHTFTSSSADLPGEQYALSATVEWYFEWWINGIYQGEFNSFDATSPFTYQVGEIQSVEVN